jgi:pyruvate dehydrogenase E2 component (dihydrolipoamide acetyltransferase)
MIEFKMPSLGADIDEGILREWRVKVGDRVKRGDIIAEVEIQKGVVEIETFDEGVVESLLVEKGQEVPVGKVIAIINDGKDTAQPLVQAPAAKPVIAPEPVPEPKSEPTVKPVQTVTPAPEAPKESPKQETIAPPPSYTPPGARRIKATPLARALAEENSIDLTTITGTGEEGVITRHDVELAIEGRKTAAPTPPPLAATPITPPVEPSAQASPEAPKSKPSSVDSSAIRKAVAAAMSKSNREIPHYYLEATIDMSKALQWLAAFNKNQSPKNRLLSAVLLIKAVAKALEQVPELNATWEDGLVLKKDIHVGFVVSIKEGGIIVPAIHHANQKSLPEIMTTLNDLIPRARQLRLRSSELADSTITLTNLGDNASDKVFGVIYPPQVAIVGFGSVREQPFAENGMLGIRPIIHVTLAGDHRASDGLSGSRFLTIIKNLLQNPETL